MSHIARRKVMDRKRDHRGGRKVAAAASLSGLLALGPHYALAGDADNAEARAQALVSQLTLDEKVSLVTGYFPALSAQARQMGAAPSAGFVPGVERLGIPAQRATDAGLGVSNVKEMRKGDTATALPAALATAATFDPKLAYEGGAMIGAEARAKGFNVLLAGGVNLVRDAWGGRAFEYFSEDPLLSGKIGGASVAGVQSNEIVSTLKHFALNSQETGRMVVNARLDSAALHESDLLAFEIAIEDGRPGSVMCAYNKLNGRYACENDVLLNGVLKQQWGFRGWVMSDWGAVHSTEASALAGLDQESGKELDVLISGKVFYGQALKQAVQDARVPAARLDDMVRRILVGMIETGAFDATGRGEPIDLDAHALVAQRVAEAGSVLLRNERQTLPLSKALKRIAVIGGHADVGVLSGGGSSQVRSVGGVPVEIDLKSGDAAMFSRMTWHASSPLAAIKASAPGAEVIFVDGTDAQAAARAASTADAAIVFATQWRTEAEDVASLDLPAEQNALIEAVAKANPKTVVVLESGGAVTMPWLDRTPAVLATWYPGQGGGPAIARLLFGDVSPSGRLPITFPAAAEQTPRPTPPGLEMVQAEKAKGGGANPAKLPTFDVDYVEGADVGYRWHQRTGRKPLFAFGYGLSYTRFAYADFAMDKSGGPKARVRVTNVGKRAGADVAQVYAEGADALGRKTWRLAGFQRVELAPGQSATLDIDLEPRVFSRWDAEHRRWIAPSGPVNMALGRSAQEFVAKAGWRGAGDRKP